MLPNVDEFRPIHNLESMTALVAALTKRGGDRPATQKRGCKRWHEALYKLEMKSAIFL